MGISLTRDAHFMTRLPTRDGGKGFRQGERGNKKGNRNWFP